MSFTDAVEAMAAWEALVRIFGARPVHALTDSEVHALARDVAEMVRVERFPTFETAAKELCRRISPASLRSYVDTLMATARREARSHVE